MWQYILADNETRGLASSSSEGLIKMAREGRNLGMMKRVHVYVSGVVQGVFFRHHTLETAMELGVNGWVRNLPDGRVEAVFEGEASSVDMMIAFCRRGPSGAHVTDLKLREESYKGEFKGFSVKR